MIEQTKTIFTGGSGLLGGEFKKTLPQLNYPSTWEFDVTDYAQMEEYIKGKDVKLIVHAAAFTSPPRIDQNPLRAIDVNIIGTANIVKLCMRHSIRLIYISTDYVFKGDKGEYLEDDPVYPFNKYGWSKLGGECAVMLSGNYLIIRTTFGPNVFPYEKAFIDQWTCRESVSKIAIKIIAILDNDFIGTIHVGGNRQTVFEFAKSQDESREIKPLSIKEVGFKVPEDTSLNCDRYNILLKQ
jgi:dTDP-4-dehydrorhamnose reductase